MKSEEWRSIPGYEGLYEVSSLGRVRSLDHMVRNRYSVALKRGIVLRQTPDRRGYMQVHLSNGSKVETCKVHRLAATAFIGPPPTPDAQVNHIDFTKDNNVFVNLEWCTRQKNHRHAVDGGRLDGSISPKRGKKLTPAKVLSIRAASANGETDKSIGTRFGVARETVGKIIRGKIWARTKLTPPPLPACAQGHSDGRRRTVQSDA
jgi:hypothetical protein